MIECNCFVSRLHKRIRRAASSRTARKLVCAKRIASSVRDPSVRGFRLRARKRPPLPWPADNPSSSFHSASSIDRSIRGKPIRGAEPNFAYRHVPLVEGQLIHDSPSRSRGGTIQSALPRIRSSLLIREQRLAHFHSTIFIARFVRSLKMATFTFDLLIDRNYRLIERINHRGKTNIGLNRTLYARIKDARGIRATWSDNRVESRFEKSDDLRPERYL